MKYRKYLLQSEINETNLVQNITEELILLFDDTCLGVTVTGLGITGLGLISTIVAAPVVIGIE